MEYIDGMIIQAYKCPNCGCQDWKGEDMKTPESCKSCRKATFTTFCPVCNLSHVEKISEHAWSSFNNEMYNPPMWSCTRCGVWYNPRVKATIGEFEVDKRTTDSV